MLNVVGLSIPSGYVVAETADPTSADVAVENVPTKSVITASRKLLKVTLTGIISPFLQNT